MTAPTISSSREVPSSHAAARDVGSGFACGDCGAQLRLVGHGGDRAIFACMRRGCDCRVQVPATEPTDPTTTTLRGSHVARWQSHAKAAAGPWPRIR